jgi:flagellar hook-associated protein 2
MSNSIGPTYDPASTAAALADKYTAPRRQSLTAQSSQASATAKALATLNSAIVSYQASLTALTGPTRTMLSNSASFSDTTIGTASADASASAGSYAFFVERLASASQVSYAAVPDSPATAGAGTLDIKLGGKLAFTVELGAAATDADGDRILSAREVAAAINGAAGNKSLVSASVVTIGGVAQLILTAKNTGIANSVTLDAANVADAGLKSALGATPTTVVEAQDALVSLGAKGSGNAITQASNTFTNVDGVTMTFTRAHGATESPATLTVGTNVSATSANVQAFVDGYNKLKEAVDAMVYAGDPSKGVAGGAFAHDSGVKVLQSKLVSLLREAGSASLAAFGIIAKREGKLELDAERLTRQMALDPKGIDKLIGSSAATASSGIAGKLNTYLKLWSGAVDGQIKQRQAATDKLQATLTKRQEELDGQYDRFYQRYLMQFTQLQSLQSQMASNTSLFDALFGDKST